MPLYSKNKIVSNTDLLIWKIEEDFDYLFSSALLTPESLERLERFSSEKRKIEFLATRMLLQEIGLADSDLSYREDGAPVIENGFISISHTSEFVAIIVSDKSVGIDVERNREQIFRIAHKFVNSDEEKLFDTSSLQVLSVIWNIKEAMFKLCDKSGIDFRKNLNVTKIDFTSSIVEGNLIFGDEQFAVNGKLDIFDNHTLVYLMIN